MTAGTSTIRVHSTVSPDDERGLSEASQTALAIKDLWQAGETPDVAGALACHPHLRRYKSVVLDLAYQEYRLRLRSGEELDAEAFSRRFPSLQRSLYMLIEVQGLLSQDPDFHAIQGTLCWPEPGDPFLQFDLVAEIGRGTFGRVFLATEAALGNRQVVVKLAPRGGEEAEILGKLRHPNIVPIYSLQQDDATGLAAFCMPYLGRATLCDVLDHALSGPHLPGRSRIILDAAGAVNNGFDPGESSRPDAILRQGAYVNGIVHIGAQLADALAHSHGRGICHRDLKPSNVLMTPEGRPLLLDFNLSVDTRFPTTRIGGTLPYMAPEELTLLFDKTKRSRQRHYDPRSDLFSLGVILYELLTGTLPFGAIPSKRSVDELAGQLYQRQRAGPIPIREINGEVDVRLAALVESCLAFEPERRPETAQALAAALRKELAPVRRTRRWMGNHRRLVASAAATLATLTLAVVLFFALRPSYSERQLQRGLAYSQQGQYTLALESLNDSIRANPLSGEALFVRAKAYQRLGRFQMARQDYKAAYRLTPVPLLKACEGYCLSQMKYRKDAIAAYRLALDTGYASPAVLYNNIGFSYLVLGQFHDAEECLQRAIQLDENLQAAHHNLLLVYLKQAVQRQPLPAAAFVPATKAIEIGPPTAELYRDVAALYATAAKQDSTRIPSAIQYVAKAVQLGLRPEVFLSDTTYSELQKEPAFRDAIKKPGAESNSSSRAVRLIDPLGTP